MKVISSIYAFISVTATTVSGRQGLSRGSTCKQSRDCQSQNCMPNCHDTDTAYCIEADWFFNRHGLGLPSCITAEDFKRKMQYTTGRLLGETCHNANNCMTMHCIPECKSTLWKCIEPKVFFERNSILPPVCIAEETIKFLIELKVPAASKNLGEECSGHLNCVSGNCVPACEAPSNESRCIEPRWSFTMYNLPVPSCVDSDTTKSLLQLSGATGDGTVGSFGNFLSGKQAGSNTVHSVLDRNNDVKAIKAISSARKVEQKSTEIKNVTTEPSHIDNAVTKRNDGAKKVDKAPKQKQSTDAQIVKTKITKSIVDKNLRKKPVVHQPKQESKDNTSLRKDAQQEQETNVRSVENVVKTIAQDQTITMKSSSNNNNDPEIKKSSLKDVAGDMEAIKLEAEGLEFLRKIDLQAMQFQSDAMKDLRREAPAKGIMHIFAIWMGSFQMYFIGFFNLFNW